MRLLDPVDIARVETAVRALGRDTLERAPAWGALELLQGVVGVGFYASSVHRALRDAVSDELVDAVLARAVELFDSEGAGPSLHTGVAGLGLWIASCFDDEPLLVSIDEALLGHLAHVARAEPLLSLRAGLAGLGIYAAVRGDAPSGRRLGDAVVRILAARAVADASGITWPTPPGYAAGRRVIVRGTPIAEPGVCHGHGGILVALAALARTGHDRATTLTAAALDWLWDADTTASGSFGWMRFGAGAARRLEPLEAGTWCTGDPGVARAAWLAARAIDHADHAGRALALARKVAGRVLAGGTAGMPGRDNLCCGAAAVGHLLHRFFEDTAEPQFRDAALATMVPLIERLPAGDPSSALPLDDAIGSFQFGHLGVLTALVTMTTDAAMDWDVGFGMSLPGPPIRTSR